MKKFYVDLHLEVEAEDIDSARELAAELADQAVERLEESVIGCRHGEVEETDGGEDE